MYSSIYVYDMPELGNSLIFQYFILDVNPLLAKIVEYTQLCGSLPEWRWVRDSVDMRKTAGTVDVNQDAGGESAGASASKWSCLR